MGHGLAAQRSLQGGLLASFTDVATKESGVRVCERACVNIGLTVFFLVFGGAEARTRVLMKRADFTACADPISTNRHALTVFAPVLQYTIAAFDPNWFNSNSSQQGASLFTASIAPSLLPHANQLSLHVYVWVDTGLGRRSNPDRVVVFDRTSEFLDSSWVGRALTSNQIFALPFQPGGVTFDSKSDLYRLIVEQHQVPQMNVHFTLSLSCGGAPVTEAGAAVAFESNTPLRYVRTVQALSPGTDVSNPRPVLIYTLNPVFQIVSDLFNSGDFQYPSNEPRMEVFVYEVRDGQKPGEVLNGMEFAKFAVSDSELYPISYPPDLPTLVPGSHYTWRVRGLLRGPRNEYRYSNALHFQVDPRLGGGSALAPPEVLSAPKEFAQQVRYGEDYTQRVSTALRLILGSNYDALSQSHRDKIPAQGHIRCDGSPCSLQDLERLAREFHQGRHTVTRLNFQ